jgi:hypothetical protein
MKVKVIILIALTLSIFSPMSINLAPASHGTFLLTLDVCNAEGHPLSANSDSASICEQPFTPCVFELTTSIEIIKPVFKPYLISIQKDRPPQV